MVKDVRITLPKEPEPRVSVSLYCPILVTPVVFTADAIAPCATFRTASRRSRSGAFVFSKFKFKCAELALCSAKN